VPDDSKWAFRSLSQLFTPDMIDNMKTIAITIDEETLASVDRLVGRGALRHNNRSRLIRQAVRDYVSRVERSAEDEREAAIVHRHRHRLAQQAGALVRVQAKP
jgi:metal-responsive CopG/Arc/MetJ family transcriptional regulator